MTQRAKMPSRTRKKAAKKIKSAKKSAAPKARAKQAKAKPAAKKVRAPLARTPVAVERRRQPRVPLLADAWILTPAGRVHVQTRDLSSAGVRLCVDEGRWPTGGTLRIAIRLPEHATELELDGVVAWQAEDGLGLFFENVPDRTATLIDQVINDIIDEIRSFESEKTPVVLRQAARTR